MGGATQHDFVYLPMTNTTHIGCVLQPLVKVQLVDAQGNMLPAQMAFGQEGEPIKALKQGKAGNLFECRCELFNLPDF